MNQKPLPKKSLGQHFLVNQALCRRIVELLQPGPLDRIIEIGPGPGALSRLLEASPHNMLLYLEKDDHWARVRAAQRRSDCCTFLMDALSFHWSRLDGEWKIIGNLPYNVASPLIWDIVSQTPHLQRAVFMTQLEVAQRIAALPSTPHYGALSVWVQSFATPAIEIRIAPGSFRPPPKVDSAVLSFSPLAKKNRHPAQLRQLLHLCFQNRRKQLGGILKKSGMEFLLAGLEDMRLDPRSRPENLEPAHFGKLASLLASAHQKCRK